jgi:hypothetical protein
LTRVTLTARTTAPVGSVHTRQPRQDFNTKDVKNHEECTKFIVMKRGAKIVSFARARQRMRDLPLRAFFVHSSRPSC